MLERDVTGGIRHRWAYDVHGFANRRSADDERVTSPDITDARTVRVASTGAWEHRAGDTRVHRTRLRTGHTTSWSARAPWLDSDPRSGIVAEPPANRRTIN